MSKFKTGDRIIDTVGNVALILNTSELLDMYRVRILSVNENFQNSLNVGQELDQRFGLIDEACRLHSEYQYEPFWPATPHIEMPASFITLQDAIRFEHASKKPKYEGLALQWFNEGRCPKCGEMGRYSMSVATCSKHGEY